MNPERLAEHLNSIAGQLDQERVGLEAVLGDARRLIQTLRAEDRDPRLRRLEGLIDTATERLEPWPEGFGAALREAGGSVTAAAQEADERLEILVRALVEPRSGGWPGRLLDAAIEATGAERGFLVLHLAAARELFVVDRRGFIAESLDDREHTISRSIVLRTLERRGKMVIDDALADPELGDLESVRWLRLRSVVSVPLAPHAGVDEPLGVLYLENQRRAAAFDPQAQRLAELMAALATWLLRTLGLGRALEDPPAATLIQTGTHRIVTQDPAMQDLLKLVRRVAEGPASVLILGESGTGKELVARELHLRSPRPAKKWVAINCAAIPKELLESQLFGYVKGAFTGAEESFGGLLEAANGGSLFLDEIGDLDPSLQAKLLRVLQTGEVQRLGSKRTQRIDLRLIAATSRDLEQGMRDGSFLEALYYRLAVVTFELPPLRRRRADILLLLEHFLALHGPDYDRRLTLDPVAAEWLERYDFPGNVRQLENFAQRFLSLIPKGETCIRLGDLPREVLNKMAVGLGRGEAGSDQLLELPLADRDDLERRRRETKTRFDILEGELVERTIERNEGNKLAAAAELGIHRDTLYEILKRLKKARESS